MVDSLYTTPLVDLKKKSTNALAFYFRAWGREGEGGYNRM